MLIGQEVSTVNEKNIVSSSQALPEGAALVLCSPWLCHAGLTALRSGSSPGGIHTAGRARAQTLGLSVP